MKISPIKRFLPLLALATSLLALLLLIDHSPASAYSSIRLTGAAGDAPTGLAVRWNLDTPSNAATVQNGRIRYVIGDTGTRYHDQLNGPYDEFRAIQKSFNVWRDLPRSDVDFEFTGTVADPAVNGQDNRNTVYWATSGLDPSVFAETTATYNTTTGEIVDADLVFNDALDGGVGFRWETAGVDITQGQSGLSYIETIAIHEIGHLLGLDHATNVASTLYPNARQGAISQISIEDDDAAPINAAHPETRYPIEARGTVSGNVQSGGVGRLGVVVTLIDVASGRPIISALTDRQTTRTSVGDFTIEDVPPGAYWVTATPSPTGIYGSYYASPFVNFLPAMRGVPAASANTPQLLRVGEGANVMGVTIEVANATDLDEPNDSVADATSLTPGHAIGSRLEDANDEDIYELRLSPGATLEVEVYAASISSDLNPKIELLDSDGSSVLITGEFGASNFEQEARDLQFSDFMPDAINQDCRLTWTSTNQSTNKTVYLVVRGTGGVTSGGGREGWYILNTWTDATFATPDRTQSTLSASIVGGAPNGTDITVSVTPRTTPGVAIPSTQSLFVELIDVSNNSTVVGTINGSGPWDFSVARPGMAGDKVYAARVGTNAQSAQELDQRLTIPYASNVDAAQSSIYVLNTALVRDGDDHTDVEIVLRDASGTQVVNSNLTVTLQTSGGSLTQPSFDPISGNWRAGLTAPTSGTGITLTALVGGNAIGTASITLLSVAGSQNLPTPPSTSKDSGDSGCAIATSSSAFHWLALLLALSLCALALRPRPSAPPARP